MENNLQKIIMLGQFIGRYLTNSESQKEREVLVRWINEGSENKELLKSISSNKKMIEEYDVMDLFNKRVGFERFKEKVLLKSKTRALIHWKIAASIFVLVGVIGILYFFSGNASKINGELNSYTSVSTENGQRSKVILPDSSIAWLNSGSTLSYPNNFSDQSREVFLKGEAFFQVVHNEKYPFLVHTNGLNVRVLGTKFDINAYPEEDEIDVVLESGKVELTLQQYKSFTYTMTPGERATFNLTDNSSMNVSHVDASVYSSWKDGKLIFRKSPMGEVVEKLRRWYNVNIEIIDPEVYNSIFSGTIKNESYEEIFRLIGVACHVDCKIIHNYDNETKPQIIISNR